MYMLNAYNKISFAARRSMCLILGWIIAILTGCTPQSGKDSTTAFGLAQLLVDQTACTSSNLVSLNSSFTTLVFAAHPYVPETTAFSTGSAVVGQRYFIQSTVTDLKRAAFLGVNFTGSSCAAAGTAYAGALNVNGCSIGTTLIFCTFSKSGTFLFETSFPGYALATDIQSKIQ